LTQASRDIDGQRPAPGKATAVVAQSPCIAQHETVPDDVVREDAQIELVDITPEALRRRLSQGNAYAPSAESYTRAAHATVLRVGN